MLIQELKPNSIVQGPLFKEPVQVSVIIPMGSSVKLIGKGLTTGSFYDPVLSAEQVATLFATPEKEPFTGDPEHFRLGVEAMRLGLAYEYDPYFTLSIANIHPLPHQLEAVYDYFLKLASIRFLLADDPGAGKTIMAGLLIKELKIRGLISRVLIITPANLTFQWQRELKDKFRENFLIIKGDVLRSNYGANPWQENNMVISSISWVSRIDDAKDSLLRSSWDLVIVDEAHKMSAYSKERKTLAYQLGEALSSRTDHYLLMTATPHKGDPGNFCLFLELLDKDIYGDVKSLEKAIELREAPFYLRRVKEALVNFPDPETGQVLAIFTKRNVETIEFQINSEEMDFYDALTRYVEDQSIKASSDLSARGRALGFTMAMLQRRFASSTYAVRRSLERMKERRERILNDPESYRNELIARKLPDDFDDLTEEEQMEIIAQLEEVVASYDPFELKDEISQLSKLIEQVRYLSENEIESKLLKLKEVLTDKGIFRDPKMKLLVFTEHKDTLDYLVKKLTEWNLSVTQIHGGMKIGDRDNPKTRLYSERAFKEECQVMVATEAAGEGINLQFCWFMINYDIPWNPVRLEQRMGRIHRYGQDKDCLIFNFVSVNTREGRVLNKLFERIKNIEKDLDPKRTGKVFNVLGDIFPANTLEKMVRDMYAHNQTEKTITDRIVKEVDTERFRRITHSTLEGLAKKELNLAAIIGKKEEAKERRLVPEVIEEFFIKASPLAGISLREIKKDQHIYTIGRINRTLWQIGEKLERLYGRLGRDYKRIVFDKLLLKDDATLEWITPGHPLFECLRDFILERVNQDLLDGAIFYDLHRSDPVRLDVFTASVKDGRGNVLHRRLFVMQTEMNGNMTVRQPTIFLDLIPANKEENIPDDSNLPDRVKIEQALFEQALKPFLQEIVVNREKEIETISRHLEISLVELINRQNMRMAELYDRQAAGDKDPLVSANLKQVEDRIDELNNRLDKRREELAKERNCTVSDIRHYGRAWVLPHPEREVPPIINMVQSEEIERIAVEAVIKYETERGWQVQSVESENRGFDLISRKSHPEDPETAIEVRFIEVKGRAGVGDIALTSNEYRTAERLRKDYWLYVVYNCATRPEIKIHQDPYNLGCIPVTKIEHYQLSVKKILEVSEV
ncbi:MAG TPA: DUF3883 domain-containing protein [Candidatus Eremiobacteraeota bacterium]|nr:MAG: RNA polymerase-associated protein RapA [bacterium ADurb.Bin363]HPZ08961.1 DUF3883 domain-containing protein [Candidatus Eremiobacteraeota bacterium]